jgi:predicted amidohydrolase
MVQLRIGLAQTDAVLGDVQRNLQSHLELIEEARREDVQLLCFPELSLTGYALKDLVPEVAIAADHSSPPMAEMLAASQDMDLVFGFVERDRRHRHFISAAYLAQGQIVHVHRKVYLCTYGMFEEGRYWAAGSQLCAFDTQFGRMGVLICEDFWHMSSPYTLWQDGADVLLLMSAMPGRGLSGEEALTTSRSVDLVSQMYASFLTNFVLHCNRVGYEDGVSYWGGSAVFGPDGGLVAQAPCYEESLLVATLDLNALRRARVKLPLLRDERLTLVHSELRRVLRAGSGRQQA